MRNCVLIGPVFCVMIFGCQQPHLPNGAALGSRPGVPMKQDDFSKMGGELAVAIEPQLPRGWAVVRGKNQIGVRRTEHVLIYNAVGLPMSTVDPRFDEFIKPQLRATPWEIVIRWEQFDRAEYLRQKTSNENTLRGLRKVATTRKLSMEEYLSEHPGSDYKVLPRYLLGSMGLVVTCPISSPFRVYPEKISKECFSVEAIVENAIKALPDSRQP